MCAKRRIFGQASDLREYITGISRGFLIYIFLFRGQNRYFFYTEKEQEEKIGRAPPRKVFEVFNMEGWYRVKFYRRGVRPYS
jgi:hypothetical protein